MSLENTRGLDFLSITTTESLRPIIPEDIDIPLMRSQLIEAGCNLNISEQERQSLNEPKFRKLESGRGIGVKAVLGEEKAKALLIWCQERSKGGPKLKDKNGEPIEGSEGRGLMQLAADFIQLITNPNPTQADLENFCLRTNQRIRKGLLWENKGNDAAKEAVRQSFDVIPEPTSTISSVPSGSVTELWSFLTSPN